MGAVGPVQATLCAFFQFSNSFPTLPRGRMIREMEEQLELNPNSGNRLSESTSPLDEDDDAPVLSSHALAALKEFLSERQSHSVADSDAVDSEVALVSEDWRLSQFWYSGETAETVAEEVLTLCDGVVDSRVACIACPTLYAYLKVISLILIWIPLLFLVSCRFSSSDITCSSLLD